MSGPTSTASASPSQPPSTWTVAQTPAGPVTLVALSEVRAAAVGWRSQSASWLDEAESLRAQAVEKIVAAGWTLLRRVGQWTAPPDLAPVIQQATATANAIADEDRQIGELKASESSLGFFARFGATRSEHRMGRDRDEKSRELRPLLIDLAQRAPTTTVAEADALRAEARALEDQGGTLVARAQQASAWAAALDDEAGRRQAAIEAQGFDALYETAILATRGPSEVSSPLILKPGERAYASEPTTLARMATRTQYVGGSTGFSFPIGHTGIRYRVGSFRGHPVQQEVLNRVDTGRLVLTDRRLAYVGATKATSVPLDKVMHVEVYKDALSITREGRENAEFYLLSAPNHFVFLLNWILDHRAGGEA